MAGRSGSFIRNTTTQCPLIGAKPGPNTVPIVSTGFADLDNILQILLSLMVGLEEEYASKVRYYIGCFVLDGCDVAFLLKTRDPFSTTPCHGEIELTTTCRADLHVTHEVLGGGIPVGGIVMIMEDSESPHHLLLLRYFMAQGLVHDQPLLFASPLPSPQAFLGTLPNASQTNDSMLDVKALSNKMQGEGLRIAWQYRKYDMDSQPVERNRSSLKETISGDKFDFCNTFDLRKPIERAILRKANVECVNLQDISDMSALKASCKAFLTKFSRTQAGNSQVGRLALQSLCAPQCKNFKLDWEMLSFLKYLKSLLRVSNAVAMITFAPSLLMPSFSARWKHMADILVSIKAIPDEDEELANLVTDYKDIIGFLHIHKLSLMNTQVPTILDASTYSLKLHRKKMVYLEQLNQAPVNPSSGESYGTTASCSKSSKTLEF